MADQPKKILLGMLVANGDCLLATVLARQIKQDYPGCKLTWAVSDLCAQVIYNNPFVDEYWIIPLENKKAGEGKGWYDFYDQALKKKAAGEFDEVFCTQIYPSNVHGFDGTTRGTIYAAYPHPVTVDARPVLRLTNDEIHKVNEWAVEKKLAQYKTVMLFECSSFSGQSFVTPDWAMDVCMPILERHPELCVILSTHEKLTSPHPRMIIANDLGLRENAALTHHCHLLTGCSSGITWMSISDAAKRLPMVQFLKRGKGFTFASVAYDHQYWGLDTSEILETTNADKDHAITLLEAVLEKGVAACKPQYHQQLKPRFISLLKYSFMFFRRAQFGRSMAIIRRFVLRSYIRDHRPA